MSFHSTNSICELTGASLSNLRRWQRRGLVTSVPGEPDWSDAQLNEIRTMVNATSRGATSLEISLSRVEMEPVNSYGWPARRGEILSQLESGSERQVARIIRSLSRDFTGDDFINKLMKPLAEWLRADERTGFARRLKRFHRVVEHRSMAAGRISFRKRYLPLLLEIPDDVDDTYILLEVIRLTEQGFCVDILTSSSGPLSKAVIRFYAHHLVWGTDGKLRVMSKADQAAVNN